MDYAVLEKEGVPFKVQTLVYRSNGNGVLLKMLNMALFARKKEKKGEKNPHCFDICNLFL